ncbi:MAG: VOC family protein [Saprospiraceae bacterium]|jgi:predicted enzyme related to lactoylglutathione lyase|uniref:VOC family protein n=1 Tax=Candidatus Brachybacter algidus TaxID=2982024 RepID=UPI001B403FF2|nr:VOC family protein [Candidatus Brachybacter algidus]MBP7305128.1 VOC family protein [Saprospiraceae bacterium]MBK6375335.1 VOC family protein [Candidatus Brachybacter algidus]MBK6449685.1 VOC family protein [Candidatus Brachybacter algidus]MBK7604425.1 VOC family protein [Candidatus Brachybacter algidus]MBK8355410.1 VOC family protein [Candidatus Brachybacter algidus]
MSKFLGLRTTIYKVKEIEKARDWYAEVFETQPYFDQPYYVGFNIGGYELGLQPVSQSPEIQVDNVVVYWGVEDINETYNWMLKNGAEPHETPENVGGDIEVATVVDPWGNVVGLIYNPSFKLVNSND